MFTVQMILEQLDPSTVTVLKAVQHDYVSSSRIDTGGPYKEHILYLVSPEEDNIVRCSTLPGSSFLVRGSLADVLNRIMEAFDYYSAWEDDLSDASRRGCTLTELLDIAYPVINLPLIILDNNEWMVAYSYDLDQYVNQDLSDMLRFRTSAVDKIAAFNRGYNSCFQRDDVYRIPGDIFTNTGYAFNLFRGKQLAGILITDFFDMPADQGKLDMIEFLGHHIQNMLNDPASGLSIGSTELAFVHYLNNSSPETQKDLVHELHISSWKDGDPMRVIYIAPSANTGLSPNPNHALLMFNRIFGIKAAEYSDGILLFANMRLLSENSGFESVLIKIAQLSYFAGVSSSFSEISELTIMVNRAQIAMQLGEKNAGAVNYFDNHYLKYFFSMMQKEDADILKHPLPEKLKLYDKRFGSKLYNTLFIYLQNERSITKTSEKMQIHRNTLIHRIERIEEMAEGILEDPDKRLQILLTYYMFTAED